MNLNSRTELVMPAGTLDKLKFACAYGANAVYAGMPKFSLRARTNSFREEQLAEGIDYAHERGVKVYLTLNIFAHNNRVEPSLQALGSLMRLEPDAVIMSDPGLIMFARQEFPDLEIHLSTQSNTMNWAAVQFWKNQGIQRVILPRELSIREIRGIHEQVPDIDLEVFVHGAMCISYSGRCLLSSYMSHRDANLGVCTNSCRWEYRLCEGAADVVLEERNRPGKYFPIEEDQHGTYIMNSKDLCAVTLLQELTDAGVESFKIEGRTKSVYYLANIGRAYRRALDRIEAGEAFDPEVLNDVYATASRGYTTGFLIDAREESRQNYEHGYSLYSRYKFAGRVTSYDPKSGRAEVEVKNRFQVGDMIEFISPADSFCQEIREMFDPDGEPIQVAHGGGAVITVAVEQEPEPFTLLRMPLEDDN
ncbi:U32 family peptidase [candidate division KSB3 bacterium]|uniref:U32 family peptidase n=1 Tax=candidate division KSB3 bacterium TaxID=2044937 RepID=A0A2G6E3R9_9BACT|nr:MAG: U32 family peptidase [candidate division KSB3 bacterium]